MKDVVVPVGLRRRAAPEQSQSKAGTQRTRRLRRGRGGKNSAYAARISSPSAAFRFGASPAEGRSGDALGRSLEGALGETLTELCGRLAVARHAQGAEVVEVALAAAFGYGEDVVGVPQRAATVDRFHPVKGQAGDARLAAGAFERVEDSDRIGVA